MSDLDRRGFTAGLLSLAACSTTPSPKPLVARPLEPAVLGVEPLGRSPWPTDDPFLFCAYHLDAYPKGGPRMEPAASLEGRQIGRDFSGRDGWSMYHGSVVPGFPRHPHRGFETVTVTRTGLVDHADSLGATARYGEGDAQWMTAGTGIVHAEMFPLRSQAEANPLELFQIWLNLPAASKRVPAHFTMLWGETVPRHRFVDAGGKATVVTTLAGALDGKAPPAPPPDSWAAQADAHVAIWTLVLEPGAAWTLPAAAKGLSRSLYLHRGAMVSVDTQEVRGTQRIRLRSQVPVPLVAGPEGAELLLLQGRTIGEPVARHGPFVMNTEAEIREAYADYRRDGFGGWPWPDNAPVHRREDGRFAVHADGRRDTPA
ncbi:MAG: redox-sensitive bicupin YhaK (pirin superfamily) [Myxococcota bacterium]|jgi:redox-sensitive bicupin YhaK (pirin superfamily)